MMRWLGTDQGLVVPWLLFLLAMVAFTYTRVAWVESKAEKEPARKARAEAVQTLLSVVVLLALVAGCLAIGFNVARFAREVRS